MAYVKEKMQKNGRTGRLGRAVMVCVDMNWLTNRQKRENRANPRQDRTAMSRGIENSCPSVLLIGF
jgi:hypothetical protein